MTIEAFLDDLWPLLSDNPGHHVTRHEVATIAATMTPDQMALVRRLIRSANAKGRAVGSSTEEGMGAADTRYMMAPSTTDGFFKSKTKVDPRAADTPEKTITWIEQNLLGNMDLESYLEESGDLSAFKRFLGELYYDGRLSLMKELLEVQRRYRGEVDGPLAPILLYEFLAHEATQRGQRINDPEGSETALAALFSLIEQQDKMRQVASPDVMHVSQSLIGDDLFMWLVDSGLIESHRLAKLDSSGLRPEIERILQNVEDYDRAVIAQELQRIYQLATDGQITDYDALTTTTVDQILSHARLSPTKQRRTALDSLVMAIIRSAEGD